VHALLIMQGIHTFKTPSLKTRRLCLEHGDPCSMERFDSMSSWKLLLGGVRYTTPTRTAASICMQYSTIK
jgi:hypothetical protein